MLLCAGELVLLTAFLETEIFLLMPERMFAIIRSQNAREIKQLIAGERNSLRTDLAGRLDGMRMLREFLPGPELPLPEEGKDPGVTEGPEETDRIDVGTPM